MKCLEGHIGGGIGTEFLQNVQFLAMLWTACQHTRSFCLMETFLHFMNQYLLYQHNLRVFGLGHSGAHMATTSLGCLSSLNNSDSLSLPSGEENYFYHSSYVSPPNIRRLPTGLAAKYHQHTKRTSHVCCWYCSLSPNSLLLALKCNIQPEFSSSAARDVAGFRTFGIRP